MRDGDDRDQLLAAGGQALAPVGQGGGVEGLLGQPVPAGCFTAQVEGQRVGGLPVRESFEDLQDHDRADLRSGDGGPAPVAGEQFFNEGVREQGGAVLGAEGMHRSGNQQLPGQRVDVQQLGLSRFKALYASILVEQQRSGKPPRLIRGGDFTPD